MRLKAAFVGRRSDQNLLRKIFIKKWHKHVSVKQFRRRIERRRIKQLMRRVFEAFDLNVRIHRASFAKLSMIRAYFHKKKMHSIFKQWLPAALQSSHEQDKLETKKRFFRILKRQYTLSRDAGMRLALDHNRERLARKALRKLILHKEES